MSDFDQERLAKWKLWGQMRHAKLWEVIALSGDVDPDGVPHADQGDFSSCSEEFRRRLLVAENNLISYVRIPDPDMLVGINNGGGPHFTQVELKVFSKWAEHPNRSWTLPKEFPRAVSPASVSSLPSYIPRYIEFMLEAVNGLGLTPDDRVPAKTVRDWLEKNWPHDLGTSGRKIAQMVTLLRRPQDAKGGNLPTGNRDTVRKAGTTRHSKA